MIAALKPRNKLALAEYMARAKRNVALSLCQVLLHHFAVHTQTS